MTQGSRSRRGAQGGPGGGQGSGGRPTPAPQSHGPSGSRRAGRRQTSRPVPVERTFLERYRGVLLGAGAVAVIAVVGVFLFLGATQPAYACEQLSTPAPSATPAPGSSAAPLGQPQEDMGRRHIAVGSFAKYALCPPASGPHDSAEGAGPIQPRYYAKDDSVAPEGWIHNLEHGGLVVLYRCGPSDTCDDATAQTLRQFVSTFPASPVCNIPAGQISPVVARFDQMSTPYAALVWGRILLLDTLDTNEILRFWATEGERTNPEPQCAPPSPSPSGEPSAAPSSAPSSAPSASPSEAPSPSPS